MTSNCPSCASAIDLSVNASCPVCGYDLSAVTVAGAATHHVIDNAKRVRIQADVVLTFAVDCTGSSNYFAVGIPLIIMMIVTQVAAMARSLKISLQAHKDLEVDNPAIEMVLDRVEPASVATAVDSLKFEGGGDAAETHLDAIDILAKTVSWPTTPGARGVIIAICNADTKPLRDGRSPTALGEELRARGILLYLVCQSYPALEELARAAGGLIVPISNDPNEAELKDVSNKIAASMSVTLSSRSQLPVPVPTPATVSRALSA